MAAMIRPCLFVAPAPLALFAFLVPACSDGDTDLAPGPEAPDAGFIGDAAGAAPDTTAPAPDAAGSGEEDVATIGDVAPPPDPSVCPARDLIEAWPLINRLGPEDAVVMTTEGDIRTTTVNARAGSSREATSNPFVYLDLLTGEQALLTDHESLIDADWTLGFRRTAVRLNSGDSGPGGWEMALISGTTLEAVTALPGSPDFWEVDSTFDAACDVQLDPINVPMTAINFLNRFNPTGSSSWYGYGEGGVVTVPGEIYVVRQDGTDKAFKFEITGWADGVYTLRWAPLAP
jgi:hypothetical protein